MTISRANGKDWDAHIAQYKKADDRAVKAYLELKNNTTFFSGQAGLIRAIAISRYVIEQDQDFVENPNPSNIDKERFKSEPYLSSMLDKVVGGEFYRLVNETYPGRFAGSSRVLARH